MEEKPKISDGIILRICTGLSCGRHSDALEKAANQAIENANLSHLVGIEHESCFGRCFAGPNVAVERWRKGKLSEEAMLALMTMGSHEDIEIEQGVKPEDLKGIIRRRVKRLKDEEKDNA